MKCNPSWVKLETKVPIILLAILLDILGLESNEKDYGSRISSVYTVILEWSLKNTSTTSEPPMVEILLKKIIVIP